MGVAPGAGGLAALRRLAQVQSCSAMASLLATAAALLLLPYTAGAGQGIVVACGVVLSLSTFAVGVMISLRQRLARRACFVAISVAVVNAVLFCLLAYAVPQRAWPFVAWTTILLAYAAFATHRVVCWPTDDLSDEPKSDLALFISYRRDESRETVGRIHDHLRQAFEDDNIFLDVARQAAGEDYRIVIRRALERADVLLAVIGTRWLNVT